MSGVNIAETVPANQDAGPRKLRPEGPGPTGERGEGLVRASSAPFVHRRLRRHLASIEGLKNLPSIGSFVLVPNHRSYFDHFAVESLITSTLGRPAWFLTKKESFEKYLPRLWARAWYGIPIDRDAPSPQTIRTIREVLSSGDILCVYPEGTRNQGEGLLEFKPGAFRFALTERVPIIPMAMIGTDTVLAKGERWFRPNGKMHIVIGEPLEIPQHGSKQNKAETLMQAARDSIQQLMSRADENAQQLASEGAGRVRRWERLAGLAAGSPRRGERLVDLAAGSPRRGEQLAQQEIASLDALITSELDASGRIRPESVAQRQRVTRLIHTMAPDSLEVLAQQARLDGLRAVNSSRLKQLVLALRVKSKATKILRNNPKQRDANYLMGRWHLSVPRFLGGTPEKAVTHFTQAQQSSRPGDTRALSGLADTYELLGETTLMINALDRILQETDHSEPRALERLKRAAIRLGGIAQ